MTFLAEVQKAGCEAEWLESSIYKRKEDFEYALEQEGYTIKQVIPEDEYKMW